MFESIVKRIVAAHLENDKNALQKGNLLIDSFELFERNLNQSE